VFMRADIATSQLEEAMRVTMQAPDQKMANRVRNLMVTAGVDNLEERFKDKAAVLLHIVNNWHLLHSEAHCIEMFQGAYIDYRESFRDAPKDDWGSVRRPDSWSSWLRGEKERILGKKPKNADAGFAGEAIVIAQEMELLGICKQEEAIMIMRSNVNAVRGNHDPQRKRR